MVAPVRFLWEGDGFKPVSPYHQRLADQYYTIGETYELIEHKERSQRTHNHYFAALHDAWSNLPEALLAEYPTAEHLRKKALIRKGFASERNVVCSSKAEAQRIAAFMRPIDEYAIIVASEAAVRVYTAESQSRKAMGAQRFQESKKAVLEFVDELLGTQSGTVSLQAGRAA